MVCSGVCGLLWCGSYIELPMWFVVGYVVCCGVGVTSNFPCGLLWGMWFIVGHVVCCGMGVTSNFPCDLLWGGNNTELPMWFVVWWELH